MIHSAVYNYLATRTAREVEKSMIFYFCGETTEIGVPVKCETKQKRNETDRNETKRNQTKRNEMKRNETKRNFSKTKCNEKKMKNSIWHKD